MKGNKINIQDISEHCKTASHHSCLFLIQAHFWDFLELACWYWLDLAMIQATMPGLGRISLNFRQTCGFQENSSFSNSLKIEAQCSMLAESNKIQAANTSKLFQEKSKNSLDYFSSRPSSPILVTYDFFWFRTLVLALLIILNWLHMSVMNFYFWSNTS